MDKWSRSRISYKHWKNPEPRGEGNFVGQSDEHQISDNEICTIASTGEDFVRRGSLCGKSEETFTLDDALDACGFGKFQWKICLFTGLSWIGDAMELMLLSVLAPQLRCEWALHSYEVALISSTVFIGMCISSPAWGNISDKYGRRLCLLLCMCWISYFGLLSAFAPVYGWLIFLRSLVGVGLGGAPQSVTLYSEFLPVKSRGTSVMFTAAFWSVGAVLEVLLAMWVMPTLGWRWLLGLSTLPMALFICFCFWLPESPRFDTLAGNRGRAMATLRQVAKANGKTLPQGRLVSSQQSARGQIKDLFLPQYRKTTLLLMFIWFANAFAYYGIVLLTTEMLQYGYTCGGTGTPNLELNCNLECHYLTTDDYKDLLWTTFAEFPGLLVIIFLIDRIGRKKSMALCFAVFSLCILPMFACIGKTPLSIFIFIARAFISGGFQVAFVYTPEVFPTENRALAMGTCSAMSRIGALITPFVAQVLIKASVYFALMTYCVFCVIATVASLLLPIETLGRGLQETSLDQEAREQRTTRNGQLDRKVPSTDQR